MKSFTAASFWKCFNDLPERIQELSKEKFSIWKKDPFYPSLHFKCINSHNRTWSVRINKVYRALGTKVDNDIIWYWIGDHEKYDKQL
jgi:mRNA-degrading endonuclease RelE of RelBE toxin-antitoxin system